MKHDILFRGKRVDNGEWVYGYIFDDGIVESKRMFIGGLVITDNDGNSDGRYEVGVDFHEVIPETRGQYTGLTDRNGAKIFAGDIVSAQDETGTELYRFVVKFGQCGGIKSKQYEEVGFMGFYFEGTISTCVRTFFLRSDPIYWLNAYKCVIIGNIHDNLELLEGGGEG